MFPVRPLSVAQTLVDVQLFAHSRLSIACFERKNPHMERDSKKILKRLLSEGWELVSVRGSHHKFRRGEVSLIVPHPKRNLPNGTARGIAKAAGWL
jgi:predicted RNA binding protein YcfA (HicA-like mRNA interferase family)